MSVELILCTPLRNFAIGPRDLKKRTPRNGGALSNSALVRVLAGLLSRLLCLLLPWLLAGLLTLLLIRLIRLAALLRLALIVLFHINLQKIAET
jgi:hypothetical protein